MGYIKVETFESFKEDYIRLGGKVIETETNVLLYDTRGLLKFYTFKKQDLKDWDAKIVRGHNQILEKYKEICL